MHSDCESQRANRKAETTPFGEVPEPNGAAVFTSKLWRSHHPRQPSMALGQIAGMGKHPLLRRADSESFARDAEFCGPRFENDHGLGSGTRKSVIL